MKSPHNQEYKKLMQQLRALTKVSPTLKALKQKALILVDPFIGTQGNPTGTSWKYCIDGFIDTEKDEYWEIDEWIKSNEFILWILKEPITNKQLHKDCVWELLQTPKQLPNNELPSLKDSINKHYKLK